MWHIPPKHQVNLNGLHSITSHHHHQCCENFKSFFVGCQLKHHLVHTFIYTYNMFQPPDDGPMWPKYVVNIYTNMDHMVFTPTYKILHLQDCITQMRFIIKSMYDLICKI
jgi:hypothetical protein